ncbi:MAG: hypothetical protein COS85_06245 [Armatimonadetes bacterium CG07_land_8_20_14_0_80_59_28]|nr:MAG: hypothetical protein COS85_06245 [Armatimonadetes bacterium CG07_land_8_20_14_0_80_59_28]PIX38380.1 MAG: hypothetical protein COZ56_20670 [Armatimonadetes bacterium CG_4_8_14_3_um_filter_58_9]PIY44706.1 MAG: hypothetical protein COZ05_07430 [Armatimonadetes bacterium CG_4_10_14_3_um_filter_59_10]
MHPNKHIREAVRYAEALGWRLVKAGGHAHLWGTLRCPEGTRTGCSIRIMSTPYAPERHALDIQRVADRCPHREVQPRLLSVR